MSSYDTLSQAINSLKEKGYTLDFNLKEKALECKELGEEYDPSQFHIVETYRFEGMSSVDDSSVLYAIETEKGNKGTLVDAYGPYAEAISMEMAQKLKVDH